MQRRNKGVRFVILFAGLLICAWGVAQLLSVLIPIGGRKIIYRDDKTVIYESTQGATGGDYILGYYCDSLIFKEEKSGEIRCVEVVYKDSIIISICCIQESLYSAIQADTVRLRKSIEYPKIPHSRDVADLK